MTKHLLQVFHFFYILHPIKLKGATSTLGGMIICCKLDDNLSINNLQELKSIQLFAGKTKKRNPIVKLQIQSCAQNPVHSILQSRFSQKTQPATFVVHWFFCMCMCNPMGGFFFLFFIILSLVSTKKSKQFFEMIDI